MKRSSNRAAQGLIVLALGLATSLGSSQSSHAAGVAQIGRAPATMHPMFNPQPDPPGQRRGIAARGVHLTFNPQPDPPGRRGITATRGVHLTFNPQPDPPGRRHAATLGAPRNDSFTA